MPGTYAKGTTVTPSASRNEITRTLERFGCDMVQVTTARDGRAAVAFEKDGRRIMFVLLIPDVKDRRYHYTAGGQWRTDAQRRAAWEQDTRERWRALAAGIKAKLALIEAEISSVEEEFLAHIVLPDGSRFGQVAIPAIAKAYANGELPELLPGSDRS